MPDNLLAEASGVSDAANRIEQMRTAAQAIAADAQTYFGFDQGDLTMLFMDMPEVPPQYTPVIVAQASPAQQQGTERTIGVCTPIENKEESKLSAVNAVGPLGVAVNYLQNIEHKKINLDWDVYNTAKMTLLQAPKHGELRIYDQTKSGRYFSSDYSYEGPDSATVLVEVGGYKVKVIYHFVLMHGVPGSGEEGEATDDKSICPKGYMWKISSTLDAGGHSSITAIDYLPPDPSTTGATLTGDSLNGSKGSDSIENYHITVIAPFPLAMSSQGGDDAPLTPICPARTPAACDPAW